MRKALLSNVLFISTPELVDIPPKCWTLQVALKLTRVYVIAKAEKMPVF
jgi:hypothetical protein